MKHKHSTLPSSNNPFLSDVLGSIRKRSKSIKHQVQELVVERVFEQYEDERIEKLEITIKPWQDHSSAHFYIWEDRWVQVSAFERTKEAKWDWDCQGTFMPMYSGKELVAAMQSTVATFFQMNSSALEKFDGIWKPLLANKPQLVR